jgi:hypothetical protein
MDIDFSKAYDSTEHFAKEISMRRMGMPEEGIQLWKQYDSSRKMHVLTAHGLTKHVSPECGCWGQGAEETPYGWLAFMCWMSAVIDDEAKTALEIFCAATGIVVKPEKSYVYANHDGPPITINPSSGIIFLFF